MKITRRQLRQIIKEESGLGSLFGDVLSTGVNIATNILDDPAAQELVSGILRDTDAIDFIVGFFPNGEKFLNFLDGKGVDKEVFAVNLLGKLLEKNLLNVGPPPFLKAGSDDAIADAVVETLEDMNVQFGLVFGLGSELEKNEIKRQVKNVVKEQLGFIINESKITRKHLRQIIKEELSLILESPQDEYLNGLKAEVQGQMAMGFKQIVRDDNFEISDDAMDVFDEDNDGSWKVIRKDEESASLDWDQEDIRAGLIAGGIPEDEVDKVLDDLSFVSATSVQKGGFDAAFGKGAFDAIASGDMFADAAGIMKKISQRIDTPTSKKEYTGPKGKGQTRYIVTSQLASWYGEGDPDYNSSVFYLVDTVDGTKFEVKGSELPYILPTTEGEIEIFDMLPSPSSKESHLVADLNGKEFRLARRDI